MRISLKKLLLEDVADNFEKQIGQIKNELNQSKDEAVKKVLNAELIVMNKISHSPKENDEVKARVLQVINSNPFSIDSLVRKLNAAGIPINIKDLEGNANTASSPAGNIDKEFADTVNQIKSKRDSLARLGSTGGAGSNANPQDIKNAADRMHKGIELCKIELKIMDKVKDDAYLKSKVVKAVKQEPSTFQQFIQLLQNYGLPVNQLVTESKKKKKSIRKNVK